MPSATPGAGDTVYIKFTTRDSTGAPTVLTGSPAISIYKDGSSTESTAGVSLTASFDSLVGLNHIEIDTSADGTFYANGSTFYAVITTGTVSGVSVVGEVVGEFSLAAALGPAAGGVTLADAVAHGGTPGSSTATYAGAQWNITNSSGDAVTFQASTGSVAFSVFGGRYGIHAYGDETAIRAEGDFGIRLHGAGGDGTNTSGSAFYCDMGTAFPSPTISISSNDGDAVKIIPTGTNVHGINVAGGSTSGDAVHKTATDGHGDFSSGGNGKAAVVPGTLAIGS